jgi:hypothetical protein
VPRQYATNHIAIFRLIALNCYAFSMTIRLLRLNLLLAVVLLSLAMNHGRVVSGCNVDSEPLVFIVADVVRTPLRDADQSKIQEFDRVLADPNQSEQHDSVRQKREEILAKHERSAPVQLRGFATKDPFPLIADDGYSSVRVVAVQVSSKKAREFKAGDYVSLKRAPPKFSDSVTLIRTDAVERRDKNLRGGVAGPDDCGLILDQAFLEASPCAISWRSEGKPVNMSADDLDVMDWRSGTRIRFRVQNRSGFPVFGVVRVRLKTAHGAELTEFSFLCSQPIPPSRQVELFAHLNNESYHSTDLSWTLDTSCMFEVLASPYQMHDSMPVKAN